MTHRSASPLATAALVAAVAAGCVAGASPGASGAPTPSLPAGFYLRAWTTQAIEPQAAFSMEARLAIAEGRLIDTAVAVPAIYPGPLLIEPYARSISEHGISTIEDELRAQGLLVTRDFTDGTGLPGGVTAHLELAVDGTRYELSGDPTQLVRCTSGTRCIPDPGTPEAFAAFWQRITGDLAGWLGADLGPTGTYAIERLSILAVPPIDAIAGVSAGTDTWPLEPFASFGSPYAGTRCGTVSGTDLATLLPILRRSNQLTRFTDSAGEVRSLRLRPLLPGEPDVCAGSPTATPAASAPGGSGAAPTPDASGGSSSGGGSAISLGTPTVAGIGCFGAKPAFAASALSEPATAEQGADAAAEMLRALIRENATTGMVFPATGWRRVVDTPTRVLFLAEVPAADPPYVSAELTRTAATGTWQRGGYGSCRLMTVLEAPFGAATWTLGEPVAPEATELTALVSELACASGTLPTGRISDPLVVYGAGSVTITFGVVPLDGAQTCESNPPASVVVHLSEPLGDRQLVDGARYPAAPVEVANPT